MNNQLEEFMPNWWQLYLKLSKLAVVLCLVCIPLWGIVAAQSYTVRPNVIDILALTFIAVLVFGYILVLQSEGGTIGHIWFAFLINVLWAGYGMNEFHRWLVGDQIDFGSFILITLSLLAITNIFIYSVILYKYYNNQTN